MRQYEIELQETAEGELFFRIPDDALTRLGWQDGDDLKFEERDGAVLIRKIKYESVELEFDDEELLKYMKFAHDSGTTFNQLCEDAIKAQLDETDSK